MSIEVSFKRKMIRIIDDGRNDYIVVDEVDTGTEESDDPWKYRS